MCNAQVIEDPFEDIQKVTFENTSSVNSSSAVSNLEKKVKDLMYA